MNEENELISLRNRVFDISQSLRSILKDIDELREKHNRPKRLDFAVECVWGMEDQYAIRGKGNAHLAFRNAKGEIYWYISLRCRKHLSPRK